MLALAFVNSTTSSCSRTDAIRATAEHAESAALAEASASGSHATPEPTPAHDDDTAPPAQPAPLDRVAAFRIAASWLSALAVDDTATLVKLSAAQLSVTGFSVTNEPSENCAPMGTQMSEAALRANTKAEVGRVLDCLVRDSILVDSVPRIAAERWAERLSDPDTRGRAGYLKALDLEAVGGTRYALPEPLERHRAAISEQVSNGVGFSFFVTDRDGGQRRRRHRRSTPRR